MTSLPEVTLHPDGSCDCIFCDRAVAAERVETGRTWCMRPYCQAEMGRRWADNWRLVLMPKVGFAWVRADDVSGQSGKSSGR